MTQPLLTIIARMRAKKGNEDALRSALMELVAPTRKEQGCINYDFHESIDEPGLFFFYENWTGAAALDLHFQTPHIMKVQKRAPDLLDGPLELFRLRMLSRPAHS